MRALVVGLTFASAIFGALDGCSCDAPATEGEGEGREGEGAAEGEGAGAGEGEGEGVLAAALCTSGWCFENPLPDGLTLNAVWPVSASDVWAGGLGSVVHYDGSALVAGTVTVQGQLVQLARMWGSSSTDIWGAAGVLMHYDGVAWSADPVSTALGISVVDVWGLSATDVWAVGGGGAAHFDGVAWTPFSITSASGNIIQLAAVHGIAPDDVWAVGLGGDAAHFDGARWTTSTIGPPTTQLLGVFMIASDDVWASGDAQQMWHFDGQTWSAVAFASPARMAGMFGTATDDVWAAGDGGIILHWNGTSWGVAASTGVQTIFGMRGRAVDDVWAVGAGGALLHYDGSAWSRVGQGASPVVGALTSVSAVTTPAGVAAFVVGTDVSGPVVGQRQADGTWARESISGTTSLSAVVAVAADDVWAVGSQTSLHYDGTSWTPVAMPSGFAVQIHDACAVSATELWAVGDDVVNDAVDIFRGDGSGWTVDATFAKSPGSDNGPALDHVSCVASDDLWAGGVSTVVHRGADGHWLRQGTQWWAGIADARRYAAAANDVWVVPSGEPPFFNDTGAVHYDGIDWSDVPLPAGVPDQLLDVNGLSSTDVWFAGRGGIVLHFDGVTLSPVDVGASDDFRIVQPLADDDVILVTVGNAVEKWNGTTLTALSQDDSPLGTTAAWFAADDEGWMLDEVQHLKHWNGAAWTDDNTSPVIEPNALWGFTASDVWTVGFEAGAAHWDGHTWTSVPAGEQLSSENLVDVWGSGPNDVWAVGNENHIFHNTGSGFTVAQTGGPTFGVRGTSSTDVWFFGSTSVGEGSPIVQHNDGVSFSTYTTLEDHVRVQSIGDHLLAADAFLGVWRRDAGGAWTVVVANTPDPIFHDATLFGAYFISDSDGFMLAAGGINHFNGTQLTTLNVLSSGGLSAIAGTGGDVFAVGGGASILHRAP